MNIYTKVILTSLILFSSSLFAANEKFYFNGANTTEQQNSEITAAMALVKQNVKKAETIKFNLLYVTPQGKDYAVCGSFQTIENNLPKRFIISQSNLMIEKKDQDDSTNKEDKNFTSVWTNFCE